MSIDWSNDLPDYLKHYLSMATESEVLEALRNSEDELVSVLQKTDASKANFKYAEGKWTVNEVMQHIIDTERIFQYRALCIARGEKQSLPGFDQDEYAANVEVSGRSLQSMLDEFVAVRRSSFQLFMHLTNDQLNTEGLANGMKIRTIAYGFLCAGHLRHHLNVLKERYVS
jgi:hypothetical protein